MKFEDTQSYVATDDLKLAINAAITLQRPLLMKGEPGAGKAMFAEQLAESFGAKLITWHVKSTTKAHQGLYEYDTVSRLRDSQLDVDKVHDVRNYIRRGKLWEIFEAEEKMILLTDETGKADIEFPDDLLQELGKMEFYVYEINETIKAKQRPIVIITSNNEKKLPDAFLHHYFLRHIAFPDRETLQKIVNVHYLNIRQSLVSETLDIFFDVRKVPGLKKKPSTSELVDWLRLLMTDEIGETVLRKRDPARAILPLAGTLMKNERNVQPLERLAFMSRRASHRVRRPFPGRGLRDDTPGSRGTSHAQRKLPVRRDTLRGRRAHRIGQSLSLQPVPRGPWRDVRHLR